jgi:hypothetical protein
MSTGYGAPCPKCDKAPLLRFTTDGNGHHKETVIDGCECDTRRLLVAERKRKRLCRDCGTSIAHRKTQARLCEACYEESQRRVARECAKRRYHADPEAAKIAKAKRYAKNRAKYVASERERRQAIRDAENAKRAKRRRVGHPGYEAYKKQHRDWYWKNREKRIRWQAEYRARKRAERAAAAAEPLSPEKGSVPTKRAA